jgi:hypothetical protein
MTSPQRSSPRYPFFASAEITELQTGAHLMGRTSELSRNGCYFDMMNPLPVGSIVKVRILNHEQTFEAKGHVIYSHSNMGMGLAFDEVQGTHQLVLGAWLQRLGG